MPESGGARVVVLCGPKRHHRNTCATLISRGLNIVGICEADRETGGLPLWYLKLSVQRRGFIQTLSRFLARAVYLIKNGWKDRRCYDRLFDEEWISTVLDDWDGEFHRTQMYHDPETLAWLSSMDPDLLVVHTGYWVDKRVRRLPNSGLVIGGHPGITPRYRGSQSSFWAIYEGEWSLVGCTAFLLDGEVDAGPILAQERIPIEAGDSFRTLSWKGMKRIADLQADLIEEFERSGRLEGEKKEVPPGSEYFNPGLVEYFRYLLRQSEVR